MRARWLVLVGIVLALGGCDREFIKIIVTPAVDGTFERVVRLWRERPEGILEKPKILAPSDALLAAPGRIYGEPQKTPGPAALFRGVFETVPADLEDEGRVNRGGYDVGRSRLGTAHYYRERFPGRTDIHRTLVDIGVLIDAAMELLAVLAEQELAGEKGVEKLAAALRGPIAGDVKDMVTVFLVSACGTSDSLDGKENPESDEKGGFAIMAYVLQILEERGYVKLGSLARGTLTEDDIVRAALGWAARTMGRELDDSFRKSFDFARDEKRFKAAVERAFETAGLDKEDLEKRGAGILGGLVSAIFGNPSVELELRTPVAPYATNGRWSRETKATCFTARLNGHTILPPMAYAAWSIADGAWQMAHLGRVAVTGADLAGLVAWEAGLPEKDLEAWQKALDRLSPSGDLEAQLRAIRLTDEETEKPVHGATVVLKALGIAVEAEPK